jgi:hypothetical protein
MIMSKRVYISADYSASDGDRNVVEELHKWGNDYLHKVDYCDTAQVVSGSVVNDSDCRACDLKAEFNRQINASSAVIFIIGDKTANRSAGSACRRINEGAGCPCTPYKQNANGSTVCKILGPTSTPGADEDLGMINAYSYLKHEFKQAVKKDKEIIILYNSMNKQPGWLPDYMAAYVDYAHPFWTYNANWERVGDYTYIKQVLGYE